MKMKPWKGPHPKCRALACVTGEIRHDVHYKKAPASSDIPARRRRCDCPAAAGLHGPAQTASGRLPPTLAAGWDVSTCRTAPPWIVDTGSGRQGVRVHGNSSTARKIQGSPRRGEQPGAPAGCRPWQRCGCRPRPFSGCLPERRTSRERNGSRGHTIDQIVAEKLGQDTPLPSIEVAIEENGLNCGAGYGCAYTNTSLVEDAHSAAAYGA